MKCPQCKADSAVIDSRPAAAADDGIKRRRQCDGCGLRWSTVEVAVVEMVKLQEIVDKAKAFAKSVA